MKKFLRDVGLVAAMMAAGIVLRFGALAPGPPVAALFYGLTIVGAGFLLTWGAETESHFSQGLVVALLALVTVLPEYSVDIYLAWKAGANPGSEYLELAAANMTGANRLLVGAMWPLLVLVFWWRSGRNVVQLNAGNTPEVAFLAVASLYAFVIVFTGRVSWLDVALLIGIFAGYIWRVSRQSAEGGEEEPGPGAALDALPRRQEHAIRVALVLFAAAAILVVTEPFAESLIATGSRWGISRFLLIQWLAPLASEAPVIVITILFALRCKPVVALGALISDKINQWTLLVGMLPMAYSVGLGSLSGLPLTPRQDEEFFLTAAQSLFGLALLLRLRLTWRGAVALLALFVVQVSVAFTFQASEALDIKVLRYMAWLYIVLAAGLFIRNRRELPALISSGLLNRPFTDANRPVPQPVGRIATEPSGEPLPK